MSALREKVITTFGNRLRIRVCGILIEYEKILMISHRGMGPDGIFWSPPGGGMEYGTNAVENLEREFMEETNIRVKKSNFLFVHEFLKKPLHAIELFFKIEEYEGELKVGLDPELEDNQILSQARFFSWEEIKAMPKGSVHHAIYEMETLEDLLRCNSNFKF